MSNLSTSVTTIRIVGRSSSRYMRCQFEDHSEGSGSTEGIDHSRVLDEMLEAEGKLDMAAKCPAQVVFET